MRQYYEAILNFKTAVSQPITAQSQLIKVVKVLRNLERTIADTLPRPEASLLTSAIIEACKAGCLSYEVNSEKYNKLQAQLNSFLESRLEPYAKDVNQLVDCTYTLTHLNTKTRSDLIGIFVEETKDVLPNFNSDPWYNLALESFNQVGTQGEIYQVLEYTSIAVSLSPTDYDILYLEANACLYKLTQLYESPVRDFQSESRTILEQTLFRFNNSMASLDKLTRGDERNIYVKELDKSHNNLVYLSKPKVYKLGHRLYQRISREISSHKQ
jgi:hypothetical protein